MTEPTTKNARSIVAAAFLRHVGSLLCLFGLCVVFTRPLLWSLFGGICGSGDNLISPWYFWWDSYAVGTLNQAPWVTNYQYYPHETSTPAQGANTLAALLFIPITSWLGLTASFNLAILMMVFLSTVAAYSVIHVLTANRAASLLGAAVFILSPPFMWQLPNHLSTCTVVALPLVAWTFLRLVQDRGKKWVVLAGCSAALAILLNLEQIAFVTLAGVWAVVYARARPAVLKRFLGAGLLCSLLLTPILALTLPTFVTQPVHFPLWGMAEYGGCDLVSFALPNPRHPLWGDTIVELRQTFADRSDGGVLLKDEGVASLGFSLMLLLALAWRRRDQIPSFGYWAGGGLFLSIFALGVRLRVAGWTFMPEGGWFILDRLPFGIPLPFAAFHFLPGLKQFRVPSRLMLFVMFFLAVLAAYSLAQLLKERRYKTVGFLVLLMIFEYWTGPLPYFQHRPAPELVQLARQEEVSTVLTVPLGWATGFHQLGRHGKDPLFDQTVHHQRTLGGSMSRVPASAMAYYPKNYAFLANMLLWQRQDDSTLVSNVLPMRLVPDTRPESQALLRESAARAVRELGITYILCREPDRWAKTLSYLDSMLPLETVARRDDLLLLRVRLPGVTR